MQSFTAAQCPVMNVCFLYYSKLKLTKVSPESLPSAVQNLATLSSYISHMTRCFLYLRLLHRGQGSPQPSAPMNWQKKIKSHSVNNQSKGKRWNERGNPSNKVLQLFHWYPTKWITFLSGTHIKWVPLPFKSVTFWWKKKELTTVSQCPIWSCHLDRAGTQNAQIQDTRRLSLFFIHMGGKEGQSIHAKDMYIHRTLSSILLYRWGVRESP